MIKYSIITVRPSIATPFFINTPTGEEYETIMTEARAARPTSEDQEDALLAFNRIESPDGLTLTANYVFNSSVGKDVLFNDIDARAVAKDMIVVQTARAAYNQASGHTTTVEVEII